MADTDFEPGHTRRYLQQTEVAEVLDLSRNHIARMEKTGLLPTADVLIARYLRGWDPGRIEEFGREAELITEPGVKALGPARTPAQRERTRTLVAEKYSQPTRLYLGTVMVAALLDRDYSAVYTARHRQLWTPADIQIATRYGWDEEAMIDLGHKTGRITKARVNTWIVERTVDHDLDPDTEWIRRRIAAKEVPADTLRAYRKAAAARKAAKSQAEKL